MKKRNIDLYYFSGTGNTFLITKQLEKEFTKLKHNVRLFRIEKSCPKHIDTKNTVGIAFPIACGSTYPFVVDFIKELPVTHDHTEIFAFFTAAKYFFGLSNSLRKLLKKKKYRPLSVNGFVMPSNFSQKPGNSKKDKKTILRSLLRAKIFTHDLVYDLTKWKYNRFHIDFFANDKIQGKIWNQMRKLYQIEIDSHKCIRCGLCYKLCPVDNIEMDYFPEFSNHCEICMRCISFCPTNAFYFNGKNIIPYKAVDISEFLQDVR